MRYLNGRTYGTVSDAIEAMARLTGDDGEDVTFGTLASGGHFGSFGMSATRRYSRNGRTFLATLYVDRSATFASVDVKEVTA